MPHRTTADEREDRARWAGPASPGQKRFIANLRRDIDNALQDGSLCFADAGKVLEDLKAVRHFLTHRPKNSGGTGEVASAAAQALHLVERRDREIVRAVAAGEPLRKVARAAGISHQTVANIVGRSD